MNICIIYSNTNTKGKHDASGAFEPYAEKFRVLHKVPIDNCTGVKFPGVPTPKRRRVVYDAIHANGRREKLDMLALFMHGWPSGIQAGVNKNNLPNFVDLLTQTCKPSVRIVLYACLAAENDVRDSERKRLGPATDGGFADTLRDLMSAAGLTDGWVDAHKTAGNALWNPFVVRFVCQVRPQHAYPELYRGGAWLVEPGSQYWSEWCKHDNLDLWYPFMTQAQIFQELANR